VTRGGVLLKIAHMKKYAIAACLLVFLGSAFAQQVDDDLAKLNFVVIKDYNGKPVRMQRGAASGRQEWEARERWHRVEVRCEWQANYDACRTASCECRF